MTLYRSQLLHYGEVSIYSRTSMARTLIARLPRLFQTHSWVPEKKFLGCRFGITKCDFPFLLKTVYCMYSLESPQ